MVSLANFIENTPNAKFTPEKGRYHLYVSLGCPFACRVTAAINVKGLQEYVDVTIVHPVMQRTRPNDENDKHMGWAFPYSAEQTQLPGPNGTLYTAAGASPDPIHGAKFIRDLYERVIEGGAANTANVSFSVPLLWDKKLDTIVSTESADMVRMFNTAFEGLAPSTIDLYAPSLQTEIDATNTWVGELINSGVYKVGFAPTQETYEKAVEALFGGLDRVEEILSRQRYMMGKTLTETDIRLFVTLIRFDEVYYLHYKCNKKMIKDYPNILNYLRDVYQVPGFKETVDFDHMKKVYFLSNLNLNPRGVLPVGPGTDYSLPHGREQL